MSKTKIAEIVALRSQHLAKPGPAAAHTLFSDRQVQGSATSEDRQHPLVDGQPSVLQKALEQLAAAVVPQHADTHAADAQAPSHPSPSKEQDSGVSPLQPQMEAAAVARQTAVSPFSQTLATASEQARTTMEAQFKLALAHAPSVRNTTNPALVFSWGQLLVLSKQIQACRRLEVRECFHWCWISVNCTRTRLRT